MCEEKEGEDERERQCEMRRNLNLVSKEVKQSEYVRDCVCEGERKREKR